ncbi:SMI1/KNR4 family protein [uncultured Microbulbifer sp.]|uniref:SMI1/KNR4 family protein n=1 Tax=uncultured Microbulbifer sp. TaxID=348147 RepID=UPI0026392916|nr:SMI1/KNR4 family protein [uncultured Microbulbifer sp.]
MSNADLVGFLSGYVRNPQILKLEQLDSLEKEKLPDSWLDILSREPSDRVTAALSYWNEFKVEFEQVLEYLRDNLVNIDLLHSEFGSFSGYSLLYSVKANDSERILYYEGRNPKLKKINPEVLGFWNDLPNGLKNFYELHNGWRYLPSGSMGLSPVEGFFLLESEDWGILDTIGKSPVDLSKTLALYENGMGDYLCIEFKDGSKSCLLWSSSGAPKLGLDFWPVVDSWTVMGF